MITFRQYLVNEMPKAFKCEATLGDEGKFKPESAYKYAKDVLKGRFPEAEPFIAKDPEYAYLYAKDVLKGRFTEAEPFIAKDKYYFNLYKTNIIK